MKSATIVKENDCSPASYFLVTQKNWEVGLITVSNDENVLTVEFTGSGLPVSKVQLWVGTDPSLVPKTSKNIPVPGKFPYKASDYTTFHIPLSDLFTLLPEGSYDGKEVYIFAHAEFEDTEIESRNDKIRHPK